MKTQHLKTVPSLGILTVFTLCFQYAFSFTIALIQSFHCSRKAK